MAFRTIFARLTGGAADLPASGKRGARAYGVGDIHGCLHLLNDLLAQIETDVDANPVREAYLVFVGDLIDRGPDSAGVIERLRNYSHPKLKPIYLAGNHEEYLLSILSGETGKLDSWLTYGGRECVQSYGLEPEQLIVLPEGEALMLLRRRIPDEHQRFLKSLADTFRFGDYLFVHAGIRPGLALEEQSPADLRWIRDPFLNDNGNHGFVVVHGHTIVDEVEERSNRIGIDTGAYRSGVLTALVIEGTQRRFLSTARAEAA
jgi:serine/threonine protein phosphatase 1